MDTWYFLFIKIKILFLRNDLWVLWTVCEGIVCELIDIYIIDTFQFTEGILCGVEMTTSWLVGAYPSSWILWKWHLQTFLLSGIRCSRFVLFISCLRPRIWHFSKKLYFFLIVKMVLRHKTCCLLLGASPCL
jgi:hypothetical protein